MSDRESGFHFSRRQFLATMAASMLAPALLRGQSSRTPLFDNLVFVCVDDLNDWVSCLKGHPNASTPGIDRIAEAGMLFTDCHAAAPICNPSRTATYYGMSPTTTGVYKNRQDWRECSNLKVDSSIFHWLKSHDIETIGMGKIHHQKFCCNPAWTWFWPGVSNPRPREYFPKSRFTNHLEDAQGLVWDRIKDSELEGYPVGDAAVSSKAVETLLDLGVADTRYMLNVGFYRPHLPWIVPQEFFERFPLEDIVEPFAFEGDILDTPAYAQKTSYGKGDNRRLIAAGKTKEAVQAYLASVAFVDRQVDAVFQTYESLANRERTAFILWSDNGWHLGEKEAWRKRTLWREATRVPLIIVAPGLVKPGSVCHRPVSLTALYATICDLMGTETPGHVETPSLLPLLKDPESPRTEPVITALGPNMAAMRNERWCYIRYPDGSEELYDRARDPREFQNLAAVKDEEFKNQLATLFPSHYAAPSPALTNATDDHEEDD